MVHVSASLPFSFFPRLFLSQPRGTRSIWICRATQEACLPASHSRAVSGASLPFFRPAFAHIVPPLSLSLSARSSDSLSRVRPGLASGSLLCAKMETTLNGGGRAPSAVFHPSTSAPAICFPKRHASFSCYDGASGTSPSTTSGGSAGDLGAPVSRSLLGGRPVGKLGDSTLFGTVDLTATSEFRPMSQKYAAQYEEVKQILAQRGDLSKRVISANADAYYNHLGLNEYYFQTATAQTVASNLACVIAAKILNEFSHTDYFPQIQQERDGEVFLLARASLRNRKASQNFQVEREIEKKFLGLSGKTTPYRMQCYRSSGSFFDDPADENERLRTYFLQQPEYCAETTKDGVDPSETDLSKLLDVYFFANKRNTATAEIYRRLNEEVVRDSSGQNLFINVVPRGTGYRMDLAFRRGLHTKEFFSRLGDSVTMWGFYSQRKYVEPLANGVSIITTFIEELPEDQLTDFPEMSMSRRVELLVKAIRMQYIMQPCKFTELAQERRLTVHEAAYAWAVSKFIVHFSGTVGPAFGAIEKMVKHFGSATHLSHQELYELRTRLKLPPFSEDTVLKVVDSHPDMIKRLYEEFQEMHHPRAYAERGHVLKNWEEETSLKRDIQCLDSPDAPPILLKFRLFNKHIVRTNFWKDVKQALAFRMDTSFLPEADYPERPYAILFTVGTNFTGFHARFADVARGGVRVVQSFTTQSYQRNRDTAFDEVYKLASTQNLKNKDIPEGGSKGVILLSKTDSRDEANALTKSAFKAYIDSMLDVLLTDPRVVDRLGKEEVCFLGPDEHTGTGGLMDWAAMRAKERNAWFWKAFTTGKLPAMGGIPHDTYGMTTASIETYIHGILEKKNLKEEEVTRQLVGGPDGDLGSNALLKSNTKTTSIVDGSGVLHDPEGLDINELRRLAKRRFEGLQTSAMLYDEKLLSPMGFKVSQDDRDVVLPDGTAVASGFEFRGRFHLDPRGSADLFNPCGGRPASVTPFNVDKMFDEKGKPRFKFIVEGANVFITDEARRMLEERGVILFKDASTNKGGVTSSSHEVLAALAMTDEEFAEHMQVTDPSNPPAFYQTYVRQVMERIRENARLEFNALWEESLRTGKPRCDLTDVLSAKILRLNQDIHKSDSLWQDDELVSCVLLKALPDVLVPGLMSIETLRQRVPESYLQAIFQCFLASRFYYSQQFTDNLSAFAFFDYVRHLKDSQRSSTMKREDN
ncbi:glutamate/leucine/phenylalanine/valine dehydrogenase family protein [Toxoplasma gondii GAB2-2007-GAL-DOM2]|nr:glutamate/leucine/phenylalanine/valine dehydrogenase family protein [Toxoplasma gondii GT1]KAF4638706.1 glutamate/leucine/phenylalanine/valine dehydrogenase family protein [Toxoplasma gondii]KFG46316.1 glutamate/leucine/phenylalanine/valine dehydrogenase family protein [Toxoplasma gondii GAB2-2007-GAL-DOM2]KFG54211.1 glutamate/leucine/phenylalanine/valine dehydrogenase family protein [Toxoplasma gondii FOU]RQX70624.1 glutamate/leucine/phenylalanine/valine dehydrogenase family protein [Toxopl